jgi:hypothetical protein
MKATTHALVGAVVGALVGQPVAAGLCGIVSHGVLDLVPHDDPDGIVPALVDVAGALAVLALGLLTHYPAFVAGVIGGVLPDLENGPDILARLWNGKVRWPKIFPSHWKEHQSPGAGTLRLEPFVMLLAAIGVAVVLSPVWPHHPGT